LSKNLIQKLPGDFGKMVRLSFLDLHGNMLEGLPLSMGGLVDLQFLNISSNPLRPPLKDFMKIAAVRLEHDNYRITQIHPIIQFLKELGRKMPASGDAAEFTRVGARKRSVTFHSGMVDRNEEEFGRYSESDFDDDENSNFTSRTGRDRRRSSVRSSRASSHLAPSRKHASVSSRLTSIAVGAFYFATLIFLIPFLLALMVDHTYLDNLLKGTEFWSYYKEIHAFASGIMHCRCGLKIPLQVTAPPPVEEVGFISAVFSSIYKFVASVAGIFKFW